ncbi:nicotinate-nucleotide--dimethylbenzimidazole phosphoribosyltransferase [Emcibacter nanhaiensis]|uniref:Nicotinate-nucleotide--dimethylbenzimidazole phosphoribosyltransferase n=2 Tax=Emcibacter nanhaiensis TaxID=1505037 RepID=A0A501PJZ6_9PROT|nr:nicotinate-nucleotide--dimethylbenzimidazole phosphoribosyltransferase [Emcibacter nanhaiensis]
MDYARTRQDSLTKPQGSLGKLEELSIFMAGWQGKEHPRLNQISCLVFAGNHGVTAQGISAYPPAVTKQMVQNFENGGAAINQLCIAAGAKLRVISLDLDHPTADFTKAPAMSEEELCRALQTGADAVPDDCDCLLLGEMGIGNTTAAAALSLALFGGDSGQWTGRGTGLAKDKLAHKAEVVETAVRRHSPEISDSFELLRCLGGRELAAIAGAVIAARQYRTPVLLDGFISTAAAAALTISAPDILDHCQVSHLSVEPGHRHLIETLGKSPILQLDMRLGEASGAAVALMILRASLATYNGMASFEEAHVSRSLQ